ncbi:MULTISPECIES: hypothetical protein [Clostridiaceae]|uniref:Alcohol acetyltransferase n=1 Tax=Clostridium facile TaxID=2763035 RepID=A0ABR7ITH1_9CLOT|nr:MULTISPECIES: hypothetical protein [Clostridiaceae]MBC5788449.1 hypothetical protein [Clostridium facile]
MKQRKQEKEHGWYRLDNAAKLFPSISNTENSNVFRMVCELTESVDRNTLQTAAEKTLAVFPSFRVRLRRGLFWNFLEYNPNPFKIHRDIHPPCSYFKGISQRGYLFEVSYYKNKINLDLFHVLADGTGAMQFLRMLVYHYLQIAHERELTESTIPDNCLATPSSRSEDAFHKYYQKSKKDAPFEKKAYRITGSKLMPGEIKIITGHMPVKQVLQLAKSHQATLTTYLTAVVIYSIYENMPARKRKRPVKVNIPVNLRNHFPSVTSRNFFACIETGYTFDQQQPTFEQVLEQVNQQVKGQLSSDKLSQRINFTVATEKNPIVRCLPLALKDIGLKIAYKQGEIAYSTALSNMGKVSMPEYLQPYIKNFNLIMSPSPFQPVKFGVCSYGDTLNFTYSAAMEPVDIPRHIFRYLSKQGVEVTITTNEVKRDETV